MNALVMRECEICSRAIALWGSLLAGLIFGFAFVNDKSRYQVYEIGLTIFFGLMAALFVSYLFASRKKFELRGSLVAIGFVAAIYAWCQIWWGFKLGPWFAVVAFPALFHLIAFVIHRYIPQSEEVHVPQGEELCIA